MREHPTQYVLLVRALEEVDSKGQLLTLAQREAATRRALMVTGLVGEQVEPTSVRSLREQETIVRRARQLYEILLRRMPSLPSVLELARLGSGLAPLLIVGTLLLSLVTSTLGPQDHINIVSAPLLLLLAWNVGIVLLSLLRPLLRLLVGRDPLPSHDHADSSLVMRAASIYLKLALMRRRYVWRRSHRGSPEQTRISGEAFLRFGALWSKVSRRLMEARARRMLHLVAAALVLGFVGGLYLRVEVFHFHATWWSVLLDADQVQRLLSWVLGPAAHLLEVQIPDVAPLRAPLGGDPTIWLRLYTVTALIWVVLPRLVLMLLEARRCSRLAKDLPLDLDDPYYRGILRPR